MSFASEVKKELLVINDLNSCCKKALVYGILQGCSEIMITSSGYKIIIKSPLLNILFVIVPILKSLYDLNIGMSYKEENGLQNRRFYYLEIIDHAEEIISDFKLMPFVKLSKKDEIIANECCKQAFIRGLFVAKGSMNDPRKKCYHFEIASNKENVIKLAESILKQKDINAFTTQRRNQIVLYIKKCEDISKCLAYMGALSGMFYFEDQRILRDVSNMANRVMNCDIANQVKCTKNADNQLEMIEYIRKSGNFEKMPVRLQTICLLREEFPDESYGVLSVNSDQFFGKMLSKSGITHCMRDLTLYYQDLINKNSQK